MRVGFWNFDRPHTPFIDLGPLNVMHGFSGIFGNINNAMIIWGILRDQGNQQVKMVVDQNLNTYVTLTLHIAYSGLGLRPLG